MAAILANLINSAMLVYLDDLIILGSTPQEHADNLIKVLDTLAKHNLKINLKKCSFFQKNVEFLGHEIGKEGVKPLFDKVQAIREFPRPSSPKEVSSFLGLVGYYRKFIRDFAKISRPLDALRKTDKFEWTPEAEISFEELRGKLTSDDLLVYPRFNWPFLVTCDASNTALGGVVSQLDDENRERPITFCSRALKGAERNYSALDREALAIRFVLSRNRFFLLGHPIKIMSDHHPLKYIFNNSDLNSRQSRWVEELLEYDICGFEYLPGRVNHVADALSRSVRTEDENSIPKEHSINVLTCARAAKLHSAAPPTNSLSSESISSTSSLPPPLGGPPRGNLTPVQSADLQMNECDTNASQTANECVEWNVNHLIESQDKHPVWSKVKVHLKDASKPFPAECRLSKECFSLENEVLQYESKSNNTIRTVLTPEFIPMALRICHDSPLSGHQGIPNTLERAKRNFFWTGMEKDIAEYVRKCDLCMRFKPHKHQHPPARQWPIAQEKLYRIHMDLVGPLPRSADGQRYIAVISDQLTRYIFTEALADKSAMAVATALQNFISIFGCPNDLVTDQGTEFMNETLEEVAKFYKVNKVHIKSYRPSANGLIESKNRVLINILRIIVSENPHIWSQALPIATLAVNSAYNRSIKDTPHFLMFARDPRMPYGEIISAPTPFYNVDNYKDFLCNTTKKVYESINYQLKRASLQYKREYDIRFQTSEPNIKLDSLVYCKKLQPRAHKLEPKYLGPFRVINVLKDGVEIKSLFNNKTYIVHCSYIVPLFQVEDDELQVYPTPHLDGEIASSTSA